jgi:hypothetical protein
MRKAIAVVLFDASARMPNVSSEIVTLMYETPKKTRPASPSLGVRRGVLALVVAAGSVVTGLPRWAEV